MDKYDSMVADLGGCELKTLALQVSRGFKCSSSQWDLFRSIHTCSQSMSFVNVEVVQAERSLENERKNK